jgi:ankyrin repeat protein
MSVKRKLALFLAMAVLALLGGFYLWFRAAMRVGELPALAGYGPHHDMGGAWPVVDSLVEAVRQDDVEEVERLLGRRQDSKTLNEALFAAAESAMLVVDGDTREEVKQDEAHGFHYARIAKLLLEHGASVKARDQEGGTALIQAAAFGEDDVVKLLIESGADIEAADDDGQTALIGASCNCAIVDMADTYDAVRALLERGANIEARDKRGRTALMAAAEWGRERQVRLLLSRGASIDATDGHGDTALAIAAAGGAYPTADAAGALLAGGADIEARNDNGDTALILAASGGGLEDVRIVRMLVDRGADLNARNGEGFTALQLARKNGRSGTASVVGAAMER